MARSSLIRWKNSRHGGDVCNALDGVALDRICSPWGNTAFQSTLIKELPEFIGIIGFVSKNSSPRKAIDEIECTDQILPISGSGYEAKHSTGSIDQGMDLRIRSAPRLPIRSCSGPCGPPRACFDTGRINRPQLALQRGRKEDVDFVPDARITPFPPSSVNRGIGSEDAQSASTAPLAKTKQKRVNDRFYRDCWPSCLSLVSIVFSTRLDQMFFRSRATRRSSLWMRISGIPHPRLP